MSECYRLAIITSCYNRKDRSVRCVNSLIKAAQKVPDIDLTFYVWDDGSTDGTADALRAISERVQVYVGPGDYFWSKSMHEVMKEAVKNNHDLYLMVNDDVEFFEDSLSTMTENYKESGGQCGIVGSMKFDGRFTYGGRDSDYCDIEPKGRLAECLYSNWNCFLIDRFVVKRIGLISDKYVHSFGDYDYSVRMNRAGIPQYVAAKYVGECKGCDPMPCYYNPKLTISERFKLLISPKGQPFFSFFRYHWVDKRFKGIAIAAVTYVMIIIRLVSISFSKR